jgi:hypothetical protein
MMSEGLHILVKAAVEAKKKRQEEQELSIYSAQDLQQDWEFKILRSPAGVFAKRKKVDQAVADESLAGWVLVEKLDDNRLRFKRPASAKQNDYLLPEHINPYRTELKINIVGFVFTMFGMVAGIVALVGILLWLIN